MNMPSGRIHMVSKFGSHGWDLFLLRKNAARPPNQSFQPNL